MRIKNKKTGEMIQVPPHLESDVKAIIAKGGDPMVILNVDVPEAKSGIHIKPENRGKFNATKKRTGKSTEELTHSKNPLTRKRAIFSQNAAKWNKAQTGQRVPFTDEYGNQVPQDWGNNTNYMQKFNQYLENQGFDGTDPIISGETPYFTGTGKATAEDLGFVAPEEGNLDLSQSGEGNNSMGIINTIVKAASQIEPLARNAWTSLGNHIKNRRTQAYEAKQLNKAYRQPYNTNFSEDRFGTNQGLQLFEMGGINDYRAEYGANIEVEGNELIQTPDGLAQTVYGNSHSNGGINMNLPPDSKVFSEKLKIPIKGKKKSFSKIAKPFETKKDIEHLESPTSDNINKKTADLNIALKNQKIDEIFELQESLKLAGEFGSKVQKEAMKNNEMKCGGKLPKAQSGINWLSPHISKTPEGKTTPTNLNLQGTPPQKVDWENVANQWMEINPNINSPLELQEEMYDYWLDKYQLGNVEEKQEALSQFKKMWGIFGDVKLNKDNPPKGISKNWQNWKVDDKSTLDDLSRLRGNFIDSKLEARHFLPMSQSITNSSEPNKPTDGDIIPVQKEKPLSSTKSSFNIPQAIPIPMGNIYGKDPVARFEIPNREVPFRRMSPQQQINEINRNSRAALALLGNTPTDVSNISNILTQADIQSANVIDQVNRGNIQSQMGIDQFNTQLGRQRDLSQLQEDVRFTDAIARREAAIQGQYLLDRNQGMQDLSDIFKEQRYMDFAGKVYPSKTWENMNLLTYDPNKFDLTPKEKKEKKSYGGKIKVKSIKKNGNSR